MVSIFLFCSSVLSILVLYFLFEPNNTIQEKNDKNIKIKRKKNVKSQVS